jgi:hypothetical protein
MLCIATKLVSPCRSWVILTDPAGFAVTDHVDFALKADVGCRVYESTPLAARHRRG